MVDPVKTAGVIQELMGHTRTVTPTPTASRVCDQVEPVACEAIGSVLPKDALFLLTLIESVQPRHILELGVASGASTLYMLEFLSAIESNASLTSVDVLDCFYADRSKPLGYLVPANLPTIPPNWILLPNYAACTFSKSSELQKLDLAHRYDFAFIDAHHGHPWPALDLLCLLPFTTPGSWVALHDICLTVIDEKWRVRGPQFVLQEWPLDACRSDDPIPNIGAIRLSDAGPKDVEHLMRILEIPWEYRPQPYWEKKIMEHVESFLTIEQFAWLKAAFERYEHLNFWPTE